MRVLVLSDIHANLVALETVLNAAQGKFDAIWCLGDVVGYGPRPNECIEIIRERAALCVMGNHDWAVLDRPGINVDDFNPHAPGGAVDRAGADAGKPGVPQPIA